MRSVRFIQKLVTGWRNTGPPAVILLYHRVAEVETDPQLLAVTPSHFAEQMARLQAGFRPICLNELSHMVSRSTVQTGSVVVTFDDGYADNLYNAKPLLERYSIPATVFVTTGYVDAFRSFWWDELEKLLLRPNKLPETVELTLRGRKHFWRLGPYAKLDFRVYSNSQRWTIDLKDNPTPRHEMYRVLHRLLREVTEDERKQILKDLSFGVDGSVCEHSGDFCLTSSEVRQLAAGNLIEVGAHTVTHPMLAKLPSPAQSEEIATSKSHLEAILGHSITSFAYPYGSKSAYDGRTIRAVNEAGFERACANVPATVSVFSSKLQLPRFIVRDWNGCEFERRLNQWFRE